MKSQPIASSGGFVFEDIVGSHLLNLMFGRRRYQLHYYRERDKEIDFVVTENHEPRLALEVKSGRVKDIGSETFLSEAGIHCPLALVSRENISRFLVQTDIEDILRLGWR
ncbi:MAG: DUF4143 domain-containing protein [Deltaproteobacteria bacterium]|nr:DUF4143 domain-containing protein [Deltaproteobacteria bacterium]